MDEGNVIHHGRPHGGTAIIWHQNINLSVVPINTLSKRLCAVHIKGDTFDCIFASIYIPNDDNSLNSFEIFGDVLYEISTLISLYENSDIILGGDFNVDFSRNHSRNLNIFKHFLNDEELICQSIQLTPNIFKCKEVFCNRNFIDHFY